MTQATQQAVGEEIGRRRVVFLLDACSRTELRILRQWIADHHVPSGIPWDAIAIPPTRRRGRNTRPDPRLEATLAATDDPLLTPLRVAWMPPPASGGARRRFAKLLLLGDPRDPGRVRQAIASRQTSRYQIVAGEAALVSELRERWRHAGGTDLGETTGLADFVTRQAALALERAERRVRGLRYKVPRFVREDILARPAFRGGIARLAQQSGKPEASVLREAQRYLKEVAATHSPYVIDLTAQLIHLLYTRAYGEALHYDHGELERIYALAQRHPVVFLPSHKSNLDHLVLQYALHENGHPPNHTAGGINMNFFPVGPLVRRSGVFFIRRTFKDNLVYKFVLQSYIDYLIEKRFSLEWYIEGGRSRSGKLLPPRFGLLANVVDAYRRSKSEDVILIPVAIAYDQIQDVGSYTAEQHGAAKQKESLGWFVNVIRGLQTRFGDIYIRFGKPISLAQQLGPPEPLAAEHGSRDDTEEQHLSIQKLAFEVAVRINRVTPITPTSLIALAMLGRGDRALSVPELVVALQNLVQYIRRRGLPTTVELGLDSPASVKRTIDQLVASGVVTCYAEGPEAVYAVGPDQHLTAAYYRNTIVHYFVNAGIAEIALLRAGEDHVDKRRTMFWEEAMRLRDLLKFEFFFAEKERFREEIADEIALHDDKWESALARGPAAIQALVRTFRPFNAHRILRPFLHAYRVVADALLLEKSVPFDQNAFLGRCMGLGQQYLLQRRIRSAESVSKVLFETALRLANNRGLLEGGTPDVAERRKAFAEEIRDTIRRTDAIELLAQSRVAGLIA